MINPKKFSNEEKFDSYESMDSKYRPNRQKVKSIPSEAEQQAAINRTRSRGEGGNPMPPAKNVNE